MQIQRKISVPGGKKGASSYRTFGGKLPKNGLFDGKDASTQKGGMTRGEPEDKEGPCRGRILIGGESRKHK